MTADNPHISPSMVPEYDDKADEKNWRGPEVVFGLSYDFVNPGQTVLDIGIGTGLASILFHKAGLRVYGMDLSTGMLEACRQKGFATELKEHDLTIAPYPFDDASVDHAISVGVLNHFGDLRTVFSEVARVVRDGGIFAFMVGDRAEDEEAEVVAGCGHGQSHSGVKLYRHSTEEVNRLLENNEFSFLRSVAFAASVNPDGTEAVRGKAYVAMRKSRG